MFAIEDPCLLEELRLSRVLIDWDAVNFSGLRVLEVGNLLNFGPTVRRILEILSRSNQLQHLALSGVTMSQESELHPPLPPIVLSYLSTLKLRCGDDEATDLITGVSFPFCQELQVSGINWRRLSGLPILEVIGNIIRLGNTRILFRESSLYLHRRNSLRVRFRDVQEAFRWLITVAGPILNNSPSITLVVEMKFGYEASMDILSTSSHLRNISALHLRGDWDGSPVGGNFLDCLANLGGPTGHLFPRLQELIVAVSTMSEVESLHNFTARSCTSGLQLHAIRVECNSPFF
ncbi:hypothetical protein M407DRAFT_9813 [Tulasnella calospora MUT 4182]|uniref:FBD domain-containing protein n=1 Tax=Tulasnella calospora MUT 4182 TaxID=1051891 RepID=A0A0C3LMV4_9AGAM|nr:hypothetical protein M407DRAFT_9813 [Tulasnella calospora MUT 4182]